MNKKTCNEISVRWEFVKYKIEKYGYKPTDYEKEMLKNYKKWFEFAVVESLSANGGVDDQRQDEEQLPQLFDNHRNNY